MPEAGSLLYEGEVKNAGRIAGLDAIRIFAALSVVIFHLAFWSWATPIATTTVMSLGQARFPELYDWTVWGRVGVQIFFSLSGFVIAYSASSATSAAQFAKARALRLWPAIAICATITLLVVVAVQAPPAEQVADRYIRSLLIAPYGPWIDGVYWTLAVEVAFYLVVAAALLIGARAHIENVTAIIGVVSFLYVATTALNLLPSLQRRDAELTLLMHGCQFAAGSCIYFAAHRGWNPARAIVIALCMIGGVTEIHLGSLPTADGIEFRPGVASVVWVAAVALMWASVRIDSRVDIPSLTRSVLRFLSLATYPLYLLHDMVGAATLRITSSWGFDRYLCLTLALLVTIGLACLVTATAEPWLRSTLRALGRTLWPRLLRGRPG